MTPEINFSGFLKDIEQTGFQWDGQPISWNPAGLVNREYRQEYRPVSQKVVPTSSGWRSPTSWVHTKVTRTQGTCFYTERPYYGTAKYKYLHRGVLNNEDNPDPGYIPFDMNIMGNAAINGALLNLSDQKASISENFAERAQANRMIADRVRSIARTVLDFKRGKPRLWPSVKKEGLRSRTGRLYTVPEAWLEVQYGWNPLLSDVKGALDLMRHQDSDDDYFRKTVKSTRSISDTIVWESAINKQTALVVVHRARRKSLVFVRLDYRLDTSYLHQLQQLDVVNPALITWNLLPYSFVVDWFLPVGSYLQALTADLGFTFLGGSMTQWQEVRGGGIGFKQGGDGYSQLDVIDGSPASSSISKFELRRSIFTSSPRARLPSFKNPLSLTHFANAMSLLVSAFR